ncbi:MAG: DegV family protein [Lachnospiraceae bacterium]
MSYEIITDSASNLTKDLTDQYHIHVISYIINVDGKDMLCYDENRDFDAAGKDFYDRMRTGAAASTSLINSDRFTKYFEPFLNAGKDIIFVGISSGISGTIQAAKIAADDLRESYPERRIEIIDTLSASLAEGLWAIRISELRENGASIDEVLSYFEDHKMSMNQIFTVGDLKYLKRGGRISAAEAAIGNLLSIKPILKGNELGKIVVHEKVRSRQRSLQVLVDHTVARLTDPANEYVAIAHCDACEDTMYVADRIRSLCPVKDIIIRYYDLCTGTHVGPGTIAIFFFGKDRRDWSNS